MALRGYIESKELDLPEGFTIPTELHSPLYDESFRVGDFTMGIEFPFTPRNRVAFRFADRPEVAGKAIRFSNFRLVDDGQEVLRGELLLREANGEDTTGTYICDFFTNVLKSDVLDRPLHEVMTKEISLGTTTAAILAAAAAHNAAAPSPDGTLGSTIKFPPHHNRDFYGGENRDWVATDGQEYEPGDYVYGDRVWKYVDPMTRSDKRYYEHVADSSSNADPADGGPWEPLPDGMVNNWDPAAETFRKNEIQYKTDQAFARSRYNLVPFLQLHDVVREVATAIGYRVEGDYMDDAAERRAILYSNYALDYRRSLRGMGAVDTQDITAASEYALLEIVPLADAAIYDPHDLFDAPSHAYLMPAAGNMTFRARGKVKLLADGGSPSYMRLSVAARRGGAAPGDVFLNVWHSDYYLMDTSTPPIEVEVYIDVYVHPDDYTTDQPLYFVAALDEELGAIENTYNWQLTDVTIEAVHTTIESLNSYSGTVRYADHVPDLTVGEFLDTLIKARGLMPVWNVRDRILRLDYFVNVLRRHPGTDLTPYATTSLRTALHAKRRYRIEYDDLADDEGTPEEFDLLDPVTTREDLPPPPSFIPTLDFGGKRILVENEHRYYYTATPEDRDTLRTLWVPGGTAHTPLRIERDGDEVTLTLAANPLPMARAFTLSGDEILLTRLHETGRSPAYPLRGSRPPLRITYWAGMDATSGASYPLATSAGRNAAGTPVVNDMLLTTVYDIYLKRILQLMVLEERATALFRFTPTARSLVDFARVALLGHVPFIPIRTAEDLGRSGLTEVELRKIKNTPISIVSDTPAEVEETEWQLTDLTNLYVWLDGSDLTTQTSVGGRLTEWTNKGSIPGSAVKVTDGTRPYVSTETLNLLPVVGFYGSYLKFAFDPSDEIPNHFTFVGLAKFDAIENYRTLVGGIYGGGRLRIYLSYGQINLLVNSVLGIFPEGTAVAGEWFIFSIAVTGQSLAYFNGVASPENPIADGSPTLSKGIMIGANREESVSTHLNGAIAQLVYFGGTDTFERLKAEGRLAHDYGRLDLLPADHPYKVNPPSV